MKRETFKKVYIPLLLLLLVIIIGIIGFMFIEDLDFHEAFFMTVITISTVGFKMVKEEVSIPGMYFTAVLIIFSFGIFAYVVTNITRYVVDGAFHHYYRSNRMRRKIEKLKDHVIVCGYGRNGKQVVQELTQHKYSIVVVDNDEQAIEQVMSNSELCYIPGDATNDEVLEQCKVGNAKALITTLPVDADNLFIVLTARSLNSNITIISRASDDHSDKKLKRAGATNVIMPDKIGGQRMAKLVAQPDVVEFLEFIMLQSAENVLLEEIDCDKLAMCFEGKSIRELDVRNESGANIIGLKRTDNTFIINPLPEVILSSADKVFALGTQRQISRLKDLITVGEM